MTSKQALNNIKNLFTGSPINPTQQFEIIEKDLKALEIIKETQTLSVFQDIKGIYYLALNNTTIEITKDKYDILKEVLACD